MKKRKLLIISFLTLIIFSMYFTQNNIINIKNRDIIEEKPLIINGFWNLSPFIIDDTGGGNYTWSEAVLESWCSGSGTWGDPYLIENISIDATVIQTNCIEIKNSDVYFTIKNCSLYAPVTDTAGIKLTNVNNSYLTINDCSYSYYKIRLINSFNNTLFQNTVDGETFGSTGYSIWLEDGSNNNIIENQIDDNRNYGIYLVNSHRNYIFDNVLNSVKGEGIILLNSDDNFIQENNIWSTDQGSFLPPNRGSGIYICDSKNNTVFDNTINADDYASLELINSTICNISDNYLGNGIRLRGNLLEVSSHDIDDLNRAYSSEYIYYRVNQTGLTPADFPSPGQIILVNCNDSLVSNINFPHACIEPISFHFGNNVSATNITTSNNNGYGIYYFGCNQSKINHCDLTNNREGVLIENCKENNITWNKINNNLLNGLILRGNCLNNSILYNIVSYNYPSGGSTNGGIIMETNCYNNTISHNGIFENGQVGLYLKGDDGACIDNIIFNNTIYNNGFYGVYITSSSNNLIELNNVYSSAAFMQSNGIYFRYSSQQKIINNTISNHTQSGLLFTQDCDNNNITENDIKTNTNYGIRLTSGIPYCDNYRIWNNRILNNGLFGIQIGAGTNHLIYNNTFNNPSGTNAEDDGINNNWNNTILGNFWADYPDLDADDNKIGDNPYTISGTAGSYDSIPIWVDTDDPPLIIASLPLNNSVFQISSPNFSIEIADLELNTTWYSINGGMLNFTISQTNGAINQSAWDSASDGPINLIFYANDSASNLGWLKFLLIKDTKIPNITIISPDQGENIGRTAPAFNISIDEANIDLMWYSLDNGLTNYTFNSNGTINQTAWQNLWDLKNHGDMVNITFYVNDSVGNIGFSNISVYIYNPPEENNNPSGNLPGGGGINGYNIIFFIISLGAISIIQISKHRRISN